MKVLSRLCLIIPLSILYRAECKDGVASYSNMWVAKIDGDDDISKHIANKENMELEKLEDLPGVYVMKHNLHPKSAKHPNPVVSSQLEKHDQVAWTKQIPLEHREARDIMNVACPRSHSMGATTQYRDTVDDYLWLEQWYAQDCRKDKSDGPTYDINVVPVWYEYKLFGKDIIVMFVDDGFEHGHSDLEPNWGKEYGLDLIDGDNDPMPVHTADRLFRHGTRCAGVVAMVADNKECGAGIAPLVTFGGVRLLSGRPSNDLNDYKALSFKAKIVHVYSNSWGPNDDGKTMSPLGPLTTSAFKFGTTMGRWKKGAIYVFAGGNGKPDGDMCGSDPFVSSIYTIAVASTDQSGHVARYSERCASIMVTAYSGDGRTIHNVVTTDVKGKCTREHTGTSAAAPMIAGVIALVLEMNPELSWRDVQHLLAWTCEVSPLRDNYGWRRNAAGFWYSSDFGFGMVNAMNMVTAAKDFVSVPPMSTCFVEKEMTERRFSREKGLKFRIETNGCNGLPTEINFLEHVQLQLSVKYTKRGDVQVVLVGPSGTLSVLLEPRENDNGSGFEKWLFDSVHFWGESATGSWLVMIFDKTGKHFNEGEVSDVALIMHGTKDKPKHYSKGARTYYEFQTPEMKAAKLTRSMDEPK